MAELPTVREALERHGLWAKKSLGQHFLLDLNLTRRIARSAGSIAGEAVIEVGPGPGGLTRALLEAGADPLIVIEKDRRFIPILEEFLASANDRLKIVEGDALKIDEAALLAAVGSRQAAVGDAGAGEKAGGSLPMGVSDETLRDSSAPTADRRLPTAAHIVSNLPYNVATPLIVKWLKAGAWRGDMTLMLQKEVAQRLAAQPGSGAYGRLSIIAQARCRVGMGFIVPARAFTPPPKVESAVLHLENRPDSYPHLDALERVTAAAFGQRRKMLRQALRRLGDELGVASEVLLSRAGIVPTARAEEIGLDDFIALTEIVRNA